MLMTRIAPLLLVAAALAACGRKGARSSDFDSATAAALAGGGTAASASANVPKVAHVTGFVFAHRLDQHNVEYGGASKQFGPNDSILLSVRTQYAATTVDVSARLRQNDKTLDSAGTRVGPADSAGVAFNALRFAPIRKGTKGVIQAELFLDGKFQMAQDVTILP
jgi:hypothetical protein